MTVQTEAKPVFGPAQRTTIRGFRGFAIGIAALVAAGVGIGWAMSSSNDTPARVIAPVSVQEEGASGVPGQEPEVVWYLPGKPGIK